LLLNLAFFTAFLNPHKDMIFTFELIGICLSAVLTAVGVWLIIDLNNYLKKLKKLE
jgi:hypothetical protein